MIDIPIEMAVRHVHLSAEDYILLFGEQYIFEKIHPLSQAGQWISFVETVDIVIKRKKIKQVAIVGPWRKQTQVELTSADQKFFGCSVPLRRSGDLSGSGSCTVQGPKGTLVLTEGVIIPQPHLHCSPQEAIHIGVKNHQEVKIGFSQRNLFLSQVVVRVHPTYRLALHLSPEEMNSYWLSPASRAFVV